MSLSDASDTDRQNCHECSSRHQCLIGRQSDAARVSWPTLVQEHRFRKGDVLQLQGETADALSVLKVGTALLQRTGPDQVARPVAMAGCGQALGTGAVLGTAERLTWVAVQEGRLCRLPAAALVRSGGLDSEFLQALLHEEAQAQSRLADWSGLLHLRGVPAQLASALLQLSQLQRSTLVRLPTHTVLASLLATTRETIARSLTQLAQQGAVVRHDRWHCAIVRAPLVALLASQAVRAEDPPPAPSPVKRTTPSARDTARPASWRVVRTAPATRAAAPQALGV
ncbi:Crp/Fnr family transcriptional regulator [Paracidovorax avenae]|uniref:Crp/Fnr family transcriptional regulator n=1 Tax=Paracidovorax avenae TaxID=80867 RepID=UPI000D20BD1E|nr:Crp/Fnr family transcriptional regulator [Paracidovorax avenae]AVT03732.1 Crp/Fnr family transcriptional regulator [Paracidovorax avenae]AVT10624.1 Crp/Fnr family transcriptional regulator [Paracidovorax avenae]